MKYTDIWEPYLGLMDMNIDDVHAIVLKNKLLVKLHLSALEWDLLTTLQGMFELDD